MKFDKEVLVNNIIKDIGKNTSDYGVGEIIRYAGKNKIKDESVAEHSFMVALIILKVGKLMNLPMDIVNAATVRGVLHDMHEQYFGDLSYDFKSRPEFKGMVEDMEDKYNKMIYKEKYAKEYGQPMYDTLFKSNDVEDRLVKLADRVAALQFAEREIELGNNNREMLDIITKSQKSIEYDVDRLIDAIKQDDRINFEELSLPVSIK